jgi:TolA-binding protein
MPAPFAELHPEDLLERDARNELSADERARLEVHLARCTACRLERVVREDFLREAEADARHAPADVQRLLAGVLDVPRPAEPPVRSSPRRWRIAGLLLTGVLVSSAAWATVASFAPPQVATVLETKQAPRFVRHAAPAASGYAREETLPLVVHDIAEAPPVPVVAAAPPPLSPRTSAPAPALPLALAPTPTPTPTPTLAPAPASAPSPSSAFQQASEQRRAGQHALAAEGYRALIAAYPRSPEASASLVALGRMLLDDGDAPGALRCFDDYLRRGGSLGEDVMLGRALALQRLGRADDESAAWSALLASYPGSVHATRARRRLLDLGKM